jgi:hypothetical protein
VPISRSNRDYIRCHNALDLSPVFNCWQPKDPLSCLPWRFGPSKEQGLEMDLDNLFLSTVFCRVYYRSHYNGQQSITSVFYYSGTGVVTTDQATAFVFISRMWPLYQLEAQEGRAF